MATTTSTTAALPRLRSACDACSSAKVKCSGQRAGCNRCSSHSLRCSYSNSFVGKNPGIRAKKNKTRSSSNALLPLSPRSMANDTIENGAAALATAHPAAFSPPKSIEGTLRPASADCDTSDPCSPPLLDELMENQPSFPLSTFSEHALSPQQLAPSLATSPQFDMGEFEQFLSIGSILSTPQGPHNQDTEAGAADTHHLDLPAQHRQRHSVSHPPPTPPSSHQSSAGDVLHQTTEVGPSLVLPMLALCNRLELQLSRADADFSSCMEVLKPTVQELNRILESSQGLQPERTALMFGMITRQIGDTLAFCCRDIGSMVGKRRNMPWPDRQPRHGSWSSDGWGNTALQTDLDDECASYAHKTMRQMQRLIAAIRKQERSMASQPAFAALNESPADALERRLHKPMQELDGIAHTAITL